MKHKGSPRVELIATGDELIYGRILDTNSNWIARRLTEMGAELRRVTMVGDDYDDIAEALYGALSRDGKVIIFTGGLGPSEDDFTVNAIGRALGLKVVLDQATINKIIEIYKRRGTADPASIERGSRMARILEGSTPVPNTIGMSVGMRLEIQGKTLFTLPGVPAEVQGIFNTQIAPILEERSEHKLLGRTFNVTMISRNFFTLYRQLQAEHPDIYIKNAATPPSPDDEQNQIRTIKVDVVLQALTMEKAEDRMSCFVSEYQRCIDAMGGGTITVI